MWMEFLSIDGSNHRNTWLLPRIAIRSSDGCDQPMSVLDDACGKCIEKRLEMHAHRSSLLLLDIWSTRRLLDGGRIWFHRPQSCEFADGLPGLFTCKCSTIFFWKPYYTIACLFVAHLVEPILQSFWWGKETGADYCRGYIYKLKSFVVIAPINWRKFHLYSCLMVPCWPNLSGECSLYLTLGGTPFFWGEYWST